MTNITLKSISALSDDELLARLATVLKDSRRLESDLVAHIAEVDARRLFAREGFPSMFQYCLEVLHLSEAEAYRRIAAARVSRRYPLVLEMLADGRIHLAGISVLRKHLTDANHKSLLAQAAHKTKEDIEILVAALSPKPDVPASIRKRPQRQPKVEASGRPAKLCPGTVGETPQPKNPNLNPDPASAVTPPTERPALPKPQPATVKPLAPARYKVEFTASEELRAKLARLERLMPSCDLAAVIDIAVSEKLERLEAKRFGRLGKTKKPRKDLADADTSPGVRGVSAAVKRFVWERDGGRCTFVGRHGRRCPERHALEFHHVVPYAMGGDRSADNIALMCRTHNRYAAELDYGRDVMSRYRRSGDAAREPRPAYGSRASLPRHRGMNIGVDRLAQAPHALVVHPVGDDQHHRMRDDLARARRPVSEW